MQTVLLQKPRNPIWKGMDYKNYSNDSNILNNNVWVNLFE